MTANRKEPADLRERFPKTTFEVVYGGIGSTDSTMGAFRLEKDIFKPGKHTLVLRMSDKKNTRSQGTACRTSHH